MKCMNVNWARRSTCNLCNAKKFSESEERTGNLVLFSSLVCIMNYVEFELLDQIR